MRFANLHIQSSISQCNEIWVISYYIKLRIHNKDCYKTSKMTISQVQMITCISLSAIVVLDPAFSLPMQHINATQLLLTTNGGTLDFHHFAALHQDQSSKLYLASSCMLSMLRTACLCRFSTTTQSASFVTYIESPSEAQIWLWLWALSNTILDKCLPNWRWEIFWHADPCEFSANYVQILYSCSWCWVKFHSWTHFGGLETHWSPKGCPTLNHFAEFK